MLFLSNGFFYSQNLFIDKPFHTMFHVKMDAIYAFIYFLQTCYVFLFFFLVLVYILKGYKVSIFVVNFFLISDFLFVLLYVAICNLVHDVETIHGLCYLLTASGNLL